MTATPRPDARPSPGWRAVRALIRRELLRTCRWQLGNRALHLADGEKVRWLPEDIERFLVTLDRAAEEMREIAGLQTLPDGGSRLMVELAIYTVAADAALRRPGAETGCAHAVVTDVGWELYRRMLRLSSLSARLFSRDPGRRLRWTIRALLVFPFHPVGAPGLAARIFRDGGDLQTHFAHARRKHLPGRPQRIARSPNCWKPFAKVGASTTGPALISSPGMASGGIPADRRRSRPGRHAHPKREMSR